VVSLEAAGGEVDALVRSSANGSSTLWHAPVASDRFTRVPNVHLHVDSSLDSRLLSLHGTTGYLLGQPILKANGTGRSGIINLFATTDGLHWQRRQISCPQRFIGVSPISPIGKQRAVALCFAEEGVPATPDRTVFSSNAGQSFQAVGEVAHLSDDGGVISAASDSTWAVITAKAVSNIYVTHNGGTTWSLALNLDDGGVGWGDFGFTTTLQGFVVHGPSRGGPGSTSGPQNRGTLYMTHDGGNSWAPVTI
jgi:hypothetical protein